MKAIKNISQGKYLRVDLDTFRLLDCYACGKPMGPETTLMHSDCWDDNEDLQEEAEEALDIAVEKSVPYILYNSTEDDNEAY